MIEENILRAFIATGIGINAFFLRGIFKDLNDVKVALAEIAANAQGREARIEKLEVNEKEVFKRLNKVEHKVL